MKRSWIIPFAGLLCALFAGLCWAQEAGDFQPATTNVWGAEYPRVDSTGRVQLRVKAPDATKVRVNFWSGPKVEMVKQSDGFWTLTTPPLVPGLHYYTFVIDGAEVSDPNSHAFFGGGKHASAVEVPEPGSTYYGIQDVPHGQVREVWYHYSGWVSELKSLRECAQEFRDFIHRYWRQRFSTSSTNRQVQTMSGRLGGEI